MPQLFRSTCLEYIIYSTHTGIATYLAQSRPAEHRAGLLGSQPAVVAEYQGWSTDSRVYTQMQRFALKAARWQLSTGC